MKNLTWLALMLLALRIPAAEASWWRFWSAGDRSTVERCSSILTKPNAQNAAEYFGQVVSGGFHAEWVEPKSVDPVTDIPWNNSTERDLVAAAVHLTPVEREALARQLADASAPKTLEGRAAIEAKATRNDPKAVQKLWQWKLDVRMYRVVRMVAFERAAWSEYLEILSQGDSRFKEADAYVELFNKAPDAFKDDVLREVATRRIGIKTAGDAGNGALVPGKRLLDRFFNHTVRADLIFREALARGNTPLEALRATFDRVRAYFGTPYSADEVLKIAQLVQVELNVGDHGANPPVASLGGSFINGRATLGKSDIDMISATLKPDQIERLNAKSPDLKFENHANMAVDMAFYARMNPFYLEVRSDRVLIHVNEPGESAYGDSIRVPASPALVVELKAN